MTHTHTHTHTRARARARDYHETLTSSLTIVCWNFRTACTVLS